MALGGLSLRYVHYRDMNAFVNELDGVFACQRKETLHVAPFYRSEGDCIKLEYKL